MNDNTNSIKYFEKTNRRENIGSGLYANIKREYKVNFFWSKLKQDKFSPVSDCCVENINTSDQTAEKKFNLLTEKTTAGNFRLMKWLSVMV